MLSLPQEVVLHICQYLQYECLDIDYIEDMEDDLNDGKDIDFIAYKQLEAVFIENNGNNYYPTYNLYATCKTFQWLNQLEYIHFDNAELYYNIITKNINGIYHGMVYNGDFNNIVGYALYRDGSVVYQNEMYVDYHYHYREINGVLYKEFEECFRWGNSCTKECPNCIQLNRIQAQMITNDPHLAEIGKIDHDWGTVIIRERSPFRKELTFDYCVDGLTLYT